MKANGAKRKIFNDAIDLLDQMEEAAAVPENAVRMLSAESIRPFCGHPFRMYYWYIHNPEYPGKDSCVIFHKHRASHPYSDIQTYLFYVVISN